MSYRDELKENYTNPEYPSRDMNDWLNIIESAELSHSMVMALVSEREALMDELGQARSEREGLIARVTKYCQRATECSPHTWG